MDVKHLKEKELSLIWSSIILFSSTPTVFFGCIFNSFFFLLPTLVRWQHGDQNTQSLRQDQVCLPKSDFALLSFRLVPIIYYLE